MFSHLKRFFLLFLHRSFGFKLAVVSLIILDIKLSSADRLARRPKDKVTISERVGDKIFIRERDWILFKSVEGPRSFGRTKGATFYFFPPLFLRLFFFSAHSLFSKIIIFDVCFV